MAGGRGELRRLSLAYLALSVGARLGPRVPRRVAYRLADRAGDLAWLVNRPARAAVRHNLRRVLGRPPPRAMVRAVFRHGARNYYDTLVIPTLSRAELLRLVRIDSWASLDRALAEGRGAIMAGAHLSSVALAGQIIAAKGYAFTTVTEQVQPPELDHLLLRLRAAGGIRVRPLGPDTLRELLAALRRNEAIGLVMDRDIMGTGVRVPFFGAPASLPGGAALLALRTGAPIISAVAFRGPDGGFVGLIGEPIPVERGADRVESVRLTTTAIARRFEQLIGAHPEQWTVFQPLWGPDGPRGRVGG